jgi:hypothetical protein
MLSLSLRLKNTATVVPKYLIRAYVKVVNLMRAITFPRGMLAFIKEIP